MYGKSGDCGGLEGCTVHILDKGVFTFMPNEMDALNGSSCEDLRNEFEPSYDGGAPF